MKKTNLVSLLAKDTGLTKEQCDLFLEAFVYEVTDALARGEKIALPNFVSFDIAERKERYARNPSTGEIKLNPAVKTVRCRVSKRMRKLINGIGVE